jgi:hypothetical protein
MTQKKQNTTISDKIADTLNDFDFELAHKVLNDLSWYWAVTPPDEDGIYVSQIPSVSMLRTTATRLLREAFNELITKKAEVIHSSASSGGLEGSCYRSKLGDYVFSLQFVVAESWSDC